MTVAGFKAMLDTLDIPVFYDHGDNGTRVPYITYTLTQDNNFFADNKVYQKIQTLRIVLYTMKRDESLMEQLEAVLSDHEIPWSQDETYQGTGDSKVYMEIYEGGFING